jgi:hypothetical protein
MEHARIQQAFSGNQSTPTPQLGQRKSSTLTLIREVNPFRERSFDPSRGTRIQ